MTTAAVAVVETIDGAMSRRLEGYVSKNLVRDKAIKEVKCLWQDCQPNLKDAFNLIVEAPGGLNMLLAVARAVDANTS